MNQKQIDKFNQIVRSTPEEERNKPKYQTLKKIGATVLVLAATAYGISEFKDLANGPEFSQTTTEYKVEQGDGLWDASRQIENVETISKNDAINYIESMPENAEALSDGLQPHETIVIPESVDKP
ncbi:MAG: hypothetical protein WBI29_02425 [Candidatus Saccharimonadales bacterium]